jgi:hypothetical protein
MKASADARATADEADVFEALIASERVDEWMQMIRQPQSANRLLHAHAAHQGRASVSMPFACAARTGVHVHS